MRFHKKLKFLIIVVLLLGTVQPIYAQSSSTNYKIEEAYFGTGGELDATSASYRARQAAGMLAAGASSSASYDLVAGFVTAETPFLEMSVSGATVNFGVLSSTTTPSFGVATGGPCGCTFTVRTYLSSEYVVVTMSAPPTNEGGAALDAKAVQGLPSSNSAVEEFGINLRANNSAPTIGGANPSNSPDNTFADGTAAAGYEVANQFKYAVGETIARSALTPTNPAIGQTNYTISYIAKRKSLTPAGSYTMNHDLVAVATY